MARKSVGPRSRPPLWERLLIRLLIVAVALVASAAGFELWLGGPTTAEFLVALALVGALVLELWWSGILSGRSPGGLGEAQVRREGKGAAPLAELSETVELALDGSGFARKELERRIAEALAQRVATAKGLSGRTLRVLRYDQGALAMLVRDRELVELLMLAGELEERLPPAGNRLEVGSRWMRLLSKVEGYT